MLFDKGLMRLMIYFRITTLYFTLSISFLLGIVNVVPQQESFLRGGGSLNDETKKLTEKIKKVVLKVREKESRAWRKEKQRNKKKVFLSVYSFGFNGISTFVGYLIPSPIFFLQINCSISNSLV